MLCSWLVSEPPTASRTNGTGVLWVLTGTHWCDDPPKRGGASPECQLVRCVDCGCLYSNTPSAEARVSSCVQATYDSHPRRCARRVRELSSFCTILTTSACRCEKM